MTEDTSAYWRKLIGSDRSLGDAPLAKYRSGAAILRRPLYFLFSLISRLLFPVKAIGIENLRRLKPPYILSSNHTSTLDYGVLMLKLPYAVKERFYAQAAKDYYDIFFTRFIMQGFANVIRVDREGDFFPALRSAAEVLRHGEPIFIAPEAARSGSGELMPFKVGVGVLAVELNIPVVPAYIKGAHEALPVGAFLVRPTPITVTYGEPIDPQPYIEMKKVKQAYDVYKDLTEELRRRIIALSR